MKPLRVLAVISLLLSHQTFSQTSRVDESVRQALNGQVSVAVLIKLQIPALPKGDAKFNKEQIRNVQNSVLSTLTQQDFQLGHRYHSIAGLSGKLTAAGLHKLERDPNVENIQLDRQGSGALSESVRAIQADDAHGLGFTGKGVTVGILDSGVNANHVDLSSDIIHQHHFLNQGADVGSGAPDQNGHGSNVTGIVTSDGTAIHIGVAPDAKIAAVRVLDANNRGWVSDWIAGVDHIVDNDATLGVDIINMSLATDAIFSGADCDNQLSLFANVVAQAKNLGILSFASSGNTGSTTSMHGPACLSEVVAVGATYDSDMGREPNSGTYQTLFGGSWPACFDATTSEQTLTCFTSRNASLDLVAPGAIITSTGFSTDQAASIFRGTSQASPHAAGVAALMLEKNPNLSPDEILQKMTATSVMVHDAATNLDFPLLNALDALDNVTSVATVANPIPADFSLEQNFPNPVTAGTNGKQTLIRYRLSHADAVKITVYDLLGREIRTIAQTFQSAGEHTLQFDATHLPNGVYFYKLQAGNFSKIRKMIVLQ
ncbi:MAG: S8 family serine peptidase [bacterium]